jgi:UDP-N-acetylmuramoyl-tripeptide--D-alanyl-D-alanine ligase
MTDTKNLYDVFLRHPVVCTDTRNITAGCIFFALKGGNFNGNKFAGEALAKGAAYSVVDEQDAVVNDKCLLTNDVLTALQNLAQHHRLELKKNGLRVVALTGSNGKTTTKELLARVLAEKYKTLATEGNLNNHIGVPLTLLKLKADHEVAVIEMGANHQKEIEMLCEIAQPDFGLITNIGLAHLEGFGGPEGVFKGKTEMFRHLIANNGFAFLLEDEPRVSIFKNQIPHLTYGLAATADISGELIHGHEFVHYKWKNHDGKIYEVHSQMIGSYNLPNMLAATACGVKLGVDAEKINRAIANYVPANNRSQIEKRGSNTLILDCYNANPSSMIAAIENMAVTPAKNKMLILGDMFELGESSAVEHQRIVNFIGAKTPHATVIIVGENFLQTTDANNFIRLKDAGDVTNWLKKNPPTETLILIKGSRGMKMETVAVAI